MSESEEIPGAATPGTPGGPDMSAVPAEHLVAPAPLIAGAAIRKLPVVSVVAGEDIAEVRDIVYDAEAGAVVGFTLNKRGILSGRHHGVLTTDRVHAIGRDAVMVADDAQLVAAGDAPEAVASPDTARNVIGNDVLAEDGTSLGEVVDVIVLAAPGPEGRAGTVVGYEVKQEGGIRRYVPLPAQLAVSGAALVVPNETEQYIVGDIGALAVAVERFRNELRNHPRRPAPDAAGVQGGESDTGAARDGESDTGAAQDGPPAEPSAGDSNE
jgi:uncharacterized protein YrrD